MQQQHVTPHKHEYIFLLAPTKRKKYYSAGTESSERPSHWTSAPEDNHSSPRDLLLALWHTGLWHPMVASHQCQSPALPRVQLTGQSTRSRGNGFNLKKGQFRSDTRSFSIMKVLTHWNRLPRELMDASSLEPGWLIWTRLCACWSRWRYSCSLQGGWTRGPLKVHFNSNHGFPHPLLERTTQNTTGFACLRKFIAIGTMSTCSPSSGHLLPPGI